MEASAAEEPPAHNQLFNEANQRLSGIEEEKSNQTPPFIKTFHLFDSFQLHTRPPQSTIPFHFIVELLSAKRNLIFLHRTVILCLIGYFNLALQYTYCYTIFSYYSSLATISFICFPLARSATINKFNFSLKEEKRID